MRIVSRRYCIDRGNVKGLKKREEVVNPAGEAPWVFAVALNL